MQLLRDLLLVAHLLGLAVIIGAFLLQVRRKSGFQFRPILIGAIVQLVSGLGLVGILEATDETVIYAKIGTKLAVAVLVLVAAIVGTIVQKRPGSREKAALPWLHIAGTGAIANVLIAVLWH